MQLYSTNQISESVGIEEAIFQGLPSDNGLYMPESIPVLPSSFWENSDKMSLSEIALEIAAAFFEEEIPRKDLQNLIEKAIDFDAPSVEVGENLYCLELFHGPSMAFKDFGARFMAAVMSYFLQKKSRKINILVATSGDTGGAVAQGFYETPNINVIILYPKGKVSEIQEKQLTTLGKNVSALEVDGTFDDCQKLVKTAFLDQELRAKHHLASANSINIARLIPQAFYYAYAYSRLKGKGLPIVFSVPSGNFGNLSAGVIAYKMGMPVQKFVAATNVNKVVPEYLRSGEYSPIKPSISTISNAMDVGDPSNFPRLKALFGNQFEEIKDQIVGFAYTDEETKVAIKELKDNFNYVVCPHTAIAYLGLRDYLVDISKATGVFLSTAHYAKFLPDVEAVLGGKLPIPERLEELISKEKVAQGMTTEYAAFKAYLEKVL
ncbi:threonine synthase [Jiulongibacter sediminis]|uniref:Threonine synthase n=1 Tax=Jiulongibacter sediminis TaxID=1605367 RepID=A0A0P7BG15_9BACT|nr:threonine synthase [Jiulongibacter sediminis]KPM49856.1 threonine synthase [Jiulongibacter sediminis]TBX26892.1 threonine synthase [Jiulongibacter sediminis]